MSTRANLNEGRIIKGIGGFYYVLDDNGRVTECRARGRFRNDGIVPLPGDRVRFCAPAQSCGFIEEILPRKSELVRPRVANVDMAAIVICVTEPSIDYMLTDKLLVHVKRQGIVPLLVINKCDLASTRQMDEIKHEYARACDVICVSAKTGERLGELRERLSQRCTCFAGQSAVGKSSLLNALFGGLDLKTGGLSEKISRGRHTTRHAELLMLSDFLGTVVDTPGFSAFEIGDLPPERLADYYEDIKPFLGQCRFPSCMHMGEPECGVKSASRRGDLCEGRYTRYTQIMKELQEKRLKKYD